MGVRLKVLKGYPIKLFKIRVMEYYLCEKGDQIFFVVWKFINVILWIVLYNKPERQLAQLGLAMLTFTYAWHSIVPCV